MDYENRILILLKFLGFRELIRLSAAYPSLLERIELAIGRIKELGNGIEFHESMRVTQVADSVLVSFVVTERSGVRWLMDGIGFCVMDLVEQGYLVRGGITEGKLMHTEQRLYGPALVRAHELESAIALYPRVIIESAVPDTANEPPEIQAIGSEQRGYAESFLNVDEDGWQFIDYISWDAVVNTIGGDESVYPNYLRSLSQLVYKMLVNQDLRIKEKGIWLHTRYLRAIELIGQLTEEDEWRSQNPETYGALISLPQFEEELFEAKLEIAKAAGISLTAPASGDMDVFEL